MPNIIERLPESVANQIAAGEVIQRPSSVIKELVENAIDAQATIVKIIVKGAGRTSIQVIDNGCGMSKTDALMAFERHATSKIRKAEDLFALHTMGFRGEALPSIVAVSQVELKTKREEDQLGISIEIAGSNVESCEPTQCATGTSFTVKNLFFNVPARRKFLKSDETEMRNIIQELHRVMLANPKVSFQLYNNDDLVYDLLSGTFKQRIIAIFGKKSKHIDRQLLQVEADTSIIKISGFICTPEAAGKNSAQFFFVNGRFMLHPYFRRAVIQAYDRMLQPEQTPMFFLSFQVNPETIDVNIHPTKTEIKFENEKEIWSIISVAVKEALGKFNITPSIDFEIDANLPFHVGHVPEHPTEPKISFNPKYNPFTNTDKPRTNSSSVRHWKDFFDDAEKDIENNRQCDNTDILNQPQFIEIKQEKQNVLFYDNNEEIGNNIIIHKNKYISLSLTSGFMFIDIKRAMERLIYDNMVNSDLTTNTPTQQLLFPEILELSAEDCCLFTEIEQDLKNLGFDLSPLGKRMYSINGVPAVISEKSDCTKIIEDLIYNVKNYSGDIRSELKNIIITSLSSSIASYKTKKFFTIEECNTLIGRLFASSNPNTTPNGKNIIWHITDDDLDSKFNN